MDKKVAGLLKGVMGKTEKVAPAKSIKIKIKFQKAAIQNSMNSDGKNKASQSK